VVLKGAKIAVILGWSGSEGLSGPGNTDDVKFRAVSILPWFIGDSQNLRSGSIPASPTVS
jgi:hypothetical protein